MCAEKEVGGKRGREVQKRGEGKIPLIDTRLFTHMHAHRSPMLVASGERAHKQRENTTPEGNGVGREGTRTRCHQSSRRVPSLR